MTSFSRHRTMFGLLYKIYIITDMSCEHISVALTVVSTPLISSGREKGREERGIRRVRRRHGLWTL